MSQLRCKKCGKLWREPVTPGPCGIRVSSTVWCDGELVEHECGGPGEACCMRGCEECGGESLTTMAELRIELAQLRARVPDVEQLTRERDEALARVAELSAPPVVPAGWRVDRWDVLDEETGDHAEPRVLGPWDWGQIDTGFERSYRPQPTPAVLRALAWAIEHDARPPHAGDEVTP